MPHPAPFADRPLLRARLVDALGVWARLVDALRCRRCSRLRAVALAARLPLLALALIGCATHAPLPTVAAVDLGRYAGTWYEIARLPNRFQAKCISDTTANYRVDGNAVAVLNACRTRNGVDTAEGRAHVVDGSGNAKLRVSFFWPFYGDYWVLALDPDYRWVLVGEPARRYAWVLARDPALDAATREALLARADALGFPRAAFLLTPHTPTARP